MKTFRITALAGLFAACSYVPTSNAFTESTERAAWRLKVSQRTTYLYFGTKNAELPDFVAGCAAGTITSMDFIGPPVDAAAEKLDRLTLQEGSTVLTVNGRFSAENTEGWNVPPGAKTVALMTFTPEVGRRRDILRMMAGAVTPIKVNVPGIPQAAKYKPHELPLAAGDQKVRTFLDACTR